MTAHRAKGKEFDTVVILDTDDRTWPNRARDERTMEAERRLFYVAFTRAQKKVILLHEKDAPLSQFVEELGDESLLKAECDDVARTKPITPKASERRYRSRPAPPRQPHQRHHPPHQSAFQLPHVRHYPILQLKICCIISGA